MDAGLISAMALGFQRYLNVFDLFIYKNMGISRDLTYREISPGFQLQNWKKKTQTGVVEPGRWDTAGTSGLTGYWKVKMRHEILYSHDPQTNS